MMDRQIIKFLVIGLAIVTGCYYDSEERLYPSTGCVALNMSFQSNIVPILQRNCYVCHSSAVNTGNITLEGYDELIKHVNSGKLAGAINHNSGFTPMPQNAPKMVGCDISKIEQWIADGALNN